MEGVVIDVLFHDTLHKKNLEHHMRGRFRSKRSRGGGGYERARIRKTTRTKGGKNMGDGLSLRYYYTVQSGDKVTR